MARVELRFHACTIRIGGFDTDADGDYFDGEVDFDLVVDSEVQRGLIAKVKQAAGSSFTDPLEVLPPSRWLGDFDYERYRACIERYGSQQVMSQIGDHRMTDANMQVRDVRIAAGGTCTFAVP
jgi:hypothetical protein